MLRILMSGVLLFLTYSCQSPTIEKPIKSYIVNFAYQEVAVSNRHLNYKLDKDKVGARVGPIEFITFNEAPENLMCFSLEDWLTVINPTLKKGSNFFHRVNK